MLPNYVKRLPNMSEMFPEQKPVWWDYIIWLQLLSTVLTDFPSKHLAYLSLHSSPITSKNNAYHIILPRRWHSKLPSPNNRGKRRGKTSCARTTKSKKGNFASNQKKVHQFCVLEHIRKSDITYLFFLHHRLSIVRILSNQKQHPRQIPYTP